MMTEINQTFIFEQIELLLSWYPDFIGCLGAIIVLVAYALLQAKKLESESFVYSFLNLIGALMILISLAYSWNLAAALMEIAWIIITLFGIVKTVFPSYLRFYK